MQKSSPSHTTGSGGGLFSRTGSIFSKAFTSPTASSRPNTAVGSLTQQTESPVTPPHKPQTSTGSPLFSSNRGSTSSRSSRKENYPRSTSSGGFSLTYSPERRTTAANLLKHSPSQSASSTSQKDSPSKQSSFDSVRQPMPHSTTTTSPLSATESNQSIAPFAMLAGPFSHNNKSVVDLVRPSSNPHLNVGYGQASVSQGPAVPLVGNGSAVGLQNPQLVYQHIHEMATKRISTLDYLRKAHDGRVYWFNTLLFNKADLSKMPYFDAKKLSRRATNYLLLGLSLPTILDLSSASPLDYLRALSALLSEFESFQQIHPPDGSTSSSLSRARIPQMFKRATHAAGTKSRRTSTAAEIGLPMGSTSDPSDLKSMTGSMASTGSATSSSFPASEQELLPGEEYAHLLTPSLPFDPDYYETFATLCDVLIDCYTRIMSLVSSPTMCGPGVAETFAKADAKVRKLIVAGVVKEFEEASRSGVKTEVAAVGKVVLGGLM
ncbi:MAG: hypothetical protein M1827_005378 [Pycnora praestabilis]|nr:MAG: hypothetical protein M1827_005378 [Pycnora praestabilis]